VPLREPRLFHVEVSVDGGSTPAGSTPGGRAPRCIVVHAALFGGVPRLYALSAERARRAIEELAALDGGFASPAEVDSASGWAIVEQEADVIPVPVGIVSAGDSAELRWTCPACGMAWSDQWSPEDELPVLLLCDCGGKADTWCLGEGEGRNKPGPDID
jgi:hypothetical protein